VRQRGISSVSIRGRITRRATNNKEGQKGNLLLGTNSADRAAGSCATPEYRAAEPGALLHQKTGAIDYNIWRAPSQAKGCLGCGLSRLNVEARRE